MHWQVECKSLDATIPGLNIEHICEFTTPDRNMKMRGERECPYMFPCPTREIGIPQVENSNYLECPLNLRPACALIFLSQAFIQKPISGIAMGMGGWSFPPQKRHIASLHCAVIPPVSVL